MLNRHAKDLIATVPEALEFIKEANVFNHAENLHEPHNAMATALSLAYLEKTAHELDAELISKTYKALELHGLTKQANELVATLKDRMAAPKVDREKEAQARVSALTDLVMGASPDLEKAAELALWLKESRYAETSAVKSSEVVDMYSCDGFMDKQAAQASLLYRGRLTANEEFTKAANTLAGMDTDLMSPAQFREICKTINDMDKQASLHRFGLNIYKEVMIVNDLQKKAYSMDMKVRLAGREIPIDKILSADFGKLEAVLGHEVATNLHGDPMTVKAVVESLPMDSQKILEAVI